MRILQEYIRLQIKDLINEAATRDMSGLALYASQSGGGMAFVLYDADEFIRQTKQNRKLTFNSSMIKGMIKVQPSKFGNCHGAWEVSAVAATGGYGPTMYDIAMGEVPTKTLMPDRNAVSPSALSVWSYYKNKRGDVEPLKLDTVPKGKDKDPGSEPLVDLNETESTSDDCFSMHFGPEKEILDYAYRLKGAPIDITQPLHAHNQIVRGLNKMKDGLGDQFQNVLTRGGSEFFGLQKNIVVS